jgi:hypothetical protein
MIIKNILVVFWIVGIFYCFTYSSPSLAMSNFSNCTYTPASQIPQDFSYASTVIQTTLSVLQVVFFPTNFVADWIFYRQHHNEKVVAARKTLEQARQEQNILRQEGEDLIGHILNEVENFLQNEHSSIDSKEEACRAIKEVHKFFKNMADSDEPIEVEIEGQ